jgi:hypothetical protein
VLIFIRVGDNLAGTEHKVKYIKQVLRQTSSALQTAL